MVDDINFNFIRVRTPESLKFTFFSCFLTLSPSQSSANNFSKGIYYGHHTSRFCFMSIFIGLAVLSSIEYRFLLFI